MAMTLNITANTPEDLKLQLLGLLSMMKGVNYKQDSKLVDTSEFDASNVEAEIPEPEEIKPVLTQERMEENRKNAPVHTDPPQPTLEEVRDALKRLRDKNGAASVKELLKDYGAGSLPELKEEDYLVVRDRALAEVA